MKAFIIFIVLLFLERSCTNVQNDNILLKDSHDKSCFEILKSNEQKEFAIITSVNNQTNCDIFQYPDRIGEYIFPTNDISDLKIELIPSPIQKDILRDTTTVLRDTVAHSKIFSLDSNQSTLNNTSESKSLSINYQDTIQRHTDIPLILDTTFAYSNIITNSEIIPAVTAQSIPKDSIKRDSNIVVKLDKTAIPADTAKISPWMKIMSLGFNLGYLLERNNPLAPNSDVITFTSAFNFGLNYYKDSSKFEMTNELHYLSSVQNENITGGVRLKRIQNDLSTLHDFSYGISKNNKVKANLILRSATPVLTIYNGDYYYDYNNKGAIQGFLSPYDLVVSPGIKYQPNQFLRMSFSIYAFQLYGIVSDKIANKGIYITDYDKNCKFKKFLFKHLGAEFNLWYDGQITEWLFVQYRLSVSTDFFESFGKNGLVDGLFITKIKIFKDFYLSHQSIIKSNFAVKFLKPFYNQMLLLTYDKSF